MLQSWLSVLPSLALMSQMLAIILALDLTVMKSRSWRAKQRNSLVLSIAWARARYSGQSTRKMNVDDHWSMCCLIGKISLVISSVVIVGLCTQWVPWSSTRTRGAITGNSRRLSLQLRKLMWKMCSLSQMVPSYLSSRSPLLAKLRDAGDKPE